MKKLALVAPVPGDGDEEPGKSRGFTTPMKAMEIGMVQPG
jgi:hypothetical protein